MALHVVTIRIVNVFKLVAQQESKDGAQLNSSSYLSTKNSIKFRAVEYWPSLPIQIDENRTCSNSQTTNSTWIKSIKGWSKLNIDGSIKDNHLAKGGVIRTEQGEWVVGFTKFIGIGKPLMAEAWALSTGLEIATHMKITKLKAETNV